MSRYVVNVVGRLNPAKKSPGDTASRIFAAYDAIVISEADVKKSGIPYESGDMIWLTPTTCDAQSTEDPPGNFIVTCAFEPTESPHMVGTGEASFRHIILYGVTRAEAEEIAKTWVAGKIRQRRPNRSIPMLGGPTPQDPPPARALCEPVIKELPHQPTVDEILLAQVKVVLLELCGEEQLKAFLAGNTIDIPAPGGAQITDLSRAAHDIQWCLESLGYLASREVPGAQELAGHLLSELPPSDPAIEAYIRGLMHLHQYLRSENYHMSRLTALADKATAERVNAEEALAQAEEALERAEAEEALARSIAQERSTQEAAAESEAPLPRDALARIAEAQSGAEAALAQTRADVKRAEEALAQARNQESLATRKKQRYAVEFAALQERAKQAEAVFKGDPLALGAQGDMGETKEDR